MEGTLGGQRVNRAALAQSEVRVRLCARFRDRLGASGPAGQVNRLLQCPTTQFCPGWAHARRGIWDGRNEETGGLTRTRAELILAAKLSGEWGPPHCEPLARWLRTERGFARPVEPNAHPTLLERGAVPLIVTRTVDACVAAGIAGGELMHINMSLMLTDVSWRQSRASTPMPSRRRTARSSRSAGTTRTLIW